jgi:transposase
MFEDEARFGRINDARRCWALEGFRPEVPVQMVREYTYLFGAVSPHDGVLDSLVLPEVNAEAMSLFLAEVAERHRRDYILMVLDGAGWHRARELVIPNNMGLVFLPPYSPELNPIEHVWEEIREASSRASLVVGNSLRKQGPWIARRVVDHRSTGSKACTRSESPKV